MTKQPPAYLVVMPDGCFVLTDAPPLVVLPDGRFVLPDQETKAPNSKEPRQLAEAETG